MAIITLERVKQHIADVTPEQIGKCFPVIGPDRKTTYLVENGRGERGEDGQIIEYQVQYDDEHGFTCTCKSGQYGFYNVRHLSGVCQHCRWVAAFIVEMEQYHVLLEQQEEERRRLENGEPITAEPPAWYNPSNKTSYYTGTRAMLALGEDGKEANDALYASLTSAHHIDDPEQRHLDNLVYANTFYEECENQ